MVRSGAVRRLFALARAGRKATPTMTRSALAVVRGEAVRRWLTPILHSRKQRPYGRPPNADCGMFQMRNVDYGM